MSLPESLFLTQFDLEKFNKKQLQVRYLVLSNKLMGGGGIFL